jgi:hypothetical protein
MFIKNIIITLVLSTQAVEFCPEPALTPDQRYTLECALPTTDLQAQLCQKYNCSCLEKIPKDQFNNALTEAFNIMQEHRKEFLELMMCDESLEDEQPSSYTGI